MRLFVALMLVATALAGCSDAEAPAALEREALAPGALRGVVVDVAIQPVEGVTVRAEPGGATVTTDDAGEFAFLDLAPGTYTLTASREGFLDSVVVATVLEDRGTPVVKVVLDRNPEAARYVSAFHFQGYFECGVFPVSCTNANIITWIVLCSAGVCLGNVTSDRSLFLQWIDGVPSHLQTELVWDSTQPLGDSLGFGIGGATEEQLSTGMATTHNYTFGPSPLMLTIQDPELAESGIGADRALLTQVVSAPSEEVPGGCVVYDPCGPGVQLMQPFETFTHAFYGFGPEPGWRFSEHGHPPTP